MVSHSKMKVLYAATSYYLFPSLRSYSSCGALSTIPSLISLLPSKYKASFRITRVGVGHSQPYRSTIVAMSTSTGSNNVEDMASNLEGVKDRIATCVADCDREEGSVRLVAVSKTKPVELLMEVYEAGQRHFGENYAQELIMKAETMPSDIQWHFIGPLQSNKAAPLVKSVGLKKLACVESVGTLKLANKLNNAVATLLGSEADNNTNGNNEKRKLGIYIQVNTSGEESKSGIASDQVASLASDIRLSCPNLDIKGLMTIGAPGDFSCFDTLVECRTKVAEILELDREQDLELSMGMSGDFEEAIKRGATSVRVGSTIFGARDYTKKA